MLTSLFFFIFFSIQPFFPPPPPQFPLSLFDRHCHFPPPQIPMETPSRKGRKPNTFNGPEENPGFHLWLKKQKESKKISFAQIVRNGNLEPGTLGWAHFIDKAEPSKGLQQQVFPFFFSNFPPSFPPLFLAFPHFSSQDIPPPVPTLLLFFSKFQRPSQLHRHNWVSAWEHILGQR